MYGHTPVNYLVSSFNDKLGVDNRAYSGRPLMGILLPEEEYYYSKF